jgi:hypothetical protein
MEKLKEFSIRLSLGKTGFHGVVGTIPTDFPDYSGNEGSYQRFCLILRLF